MPQTEVLRELVDDLRRDGMVVVGTGVSIQASDNHPAASWKGLIEDGIAYADVLPAKAALMRANAADPDFLLDAAGMVARTLKERGRFRRWLQQSVGTIPIRKPEILDAIHALGRPIATTNYDDLLTRKREARAVPWTRVESAIEILRGDRRDVLHLHGYFDEEDSVIFDLRSYDRVLADHGAQALQQAVASHKTILFVGCGAAGLSDPNIGALMQWAGNIYGDSRYKHYCLCSTGQREALESLHPHLVCVDYGDYPDLLPFLEDLAARLGNGTSPAAAARPPRASVPMYEYCYGRDAEVRKVVDALLDPEAKPLPVLGGPGMGKTTIVLKALQEPEVRKRHRSRCWFVRCYEVRTRASLAAAIAQTMGLDVTSNHEAAVLDSLDGDGSPAALALDSCEWAWEADRPGVEDFLSRLASIRTLALVATINGHRRPDGVPWRSSVRVGPLSREAARATFLAYAGQESFEHDPDLEYAEVQPCIAVRTLCFQQRRGRDELCSRHSSGEGTFTSRKCAGISC